MCLTSKLYTDKSDQIQKIKNFEGCSVESHSSQSNIVLAYENIFLFLYEQFFNEFKAFAYFSEVPESSLEPKYSCLDYLAFRVVSSVFSSTTSLAF